ncbi:hypothetical protein NC652_015500 [Populus alba x Populus x berolinensis]|nr:hypothetical protein NC652_015500 [Populus alba x Populus x berolinensis]
MIVCTIEAIIRVGSDCLVKSTRLEHLLTMNQLPWLLLKSQMHKWYSCSEFLLLHYRLNQFWTSSLHFLCNAIPDNCCYKL